MGSTSPARAAAVSPGPAGPGGQALARAAAVIRAPFTARARRELLYCLAVVLLSAVALAALLATAALPFNVMLLLRAGRPAGTAPAGPLLPAAALVVLAELVLLVTMAPRAGRGLARVHQRLAERLLGRPAGVLAPRPRGHGPVALLWAGLRDGTGWRAAGYLVAKLPVTVVAAYAVFLAVIGPVNMTYPFWWHLFRNHPPGVRLSPARALTPFGSVPVATFPGTFAAFAAGAAMLLAAPWLARGAAAADSWLMHALLGPGRLARRILDLEQTRALAVQDSAALLRRLERDLHDGAQVRLATLALHLGLAREKLGSDADPEVTELVDAAHRGAKDALAELRSLARGIHPPALDGGLADALGTLAADSAIPAELTATIAHRPVPAIETMAYFCVAELLANAAKHSQADQVRVEVTGTGGQLVLRVSDNGRGGASPAPGGGLAGLAQRVSVVDGSMRVDSPPGGPTQVTVTLPVRA